MNDMTVYCVECLRVLLADKNAALGDIRYGHSGTNDLVGAQRPLQARYVVNGTWYCATHALAVHDVHMIMEDA